MTAKSNHGNYVITYQHDYTLNYRPALKIDISTSPGRCLTKLFSNSDVQIKEKLTRF